jgi:hypothetical protein
MTVACRRSSSSSALPRRWEDLFGRPVDLVEPRAVTNPFVQADIDRSREVLYAA